MLDVKTLASAKRHRESHKTEMAERRAILWTLNIYYPYDSVTEKKSLLCWRSLVQGNTDACLCILYKIINGRVEMPLPTYFHRATTNARHDQSQPSQYV